MRLVASEADEGVKAKDERRAWPELTVFDCYACHHDLKSQSWRQKRGYKGAPGRPQPHYWPAALVPLGIEHLRQCNQDAAKRQDEYLQSQRALEATFTAQPFGEPNEVANKARKLIAWSD